jgi:hypothetical protein
MCSSRNNVQEFVFFLIVGAVTALLETGWFGN